jgi:autotransporter passenger strand-loop-strand repeat protein
MVHGSGTLDVLSGGVISGAVVSGSFALDYAESGGTAFGTAVGSGAIHFVETSGVDIGAKVGLDGEDELSSGATASGTIVSTSGSLFALSGGSISGAVVSGYAASDKVKSHATAFGTLPNPILTVQLADWVDDFDSTLAKVLAHVELPHDPDCVRFYESERRVRTVSSKQVRQPVNARGLGRWRAYADELAPLIAELSHAGILPPDTGRTHQRSPKETPP